MSALTIFILLIFISILSIDQNDEGKFAISRRIGTFISIILFINIYEIKLNKINLAILFPGLLTFIAANYLIIFGYFYDNRTVSIDKKLLGINSNYFITKCMLFTNKYRFNFDMITESESIKYPNSLGFKQYSPDGYDFIFNDPYDDGEIVDIVFENNSFSIGYKITYFGMNFIFILLLMDYFNFY